MTTDRERPAQPPMTAAPTQEPPARARPHNPGGGATGQREPAPRPRPRRHVTSDDQGSPLLRPLSDEATSDVVGAKAFNLSKLIRAGFPVPEGWVLDTAHSAVADGATASQLRAELAQLPDDRYAVRSSGLQEDLADLSFAGQYTTLLDVPRDGLAEAIRQCQESGRSDTVTAYLAQHGLSGADVAVIVQRLVPAEYAGVVFTLDPVSGADTELVIEYAAGLGEALVNGEVTPQRARYDWFCEAWLERPEPELAWLDDLAGLATAAQQVYGHPLDLEFAYADDRVWLLQARPITRLSHTGVQDFWSTADFKDGGVSAETCKTYMWSLYEYIWENSLTDFLLTSHLIERRRLRTLGRQFYGRPYWNLSVVKEVMARVPGYRERDFDEEFGITGTYAGDGQVTKITPRSLARLAPAAWAQRRLLAQREATAPDLMEDIRQRVARRRRELAAEPRGGELERGFVGLTRDDYLFSESTYFWQIFLNTIQQSLFKDAVRPHVDAEGFLDLLGGLDDISHLRPFRDLWRISHAEAPVADPAAALAEHLERFGHHSDKELDVSYPNYWEQPEAVAEQLAAVAALDDSHNPALTVARQQERFEAQLARLKADLKPKRYAKLERRVQRVRRLLWWREEFRDLSTLMYDVIRRYTLALARDYVARGLLDEVDDVWHLAVGDLWRFIAGEAIDLKALVTRNRRYYNAYRNYLSENEIMPLTPGPRSQPGSGGSGSAAGGPSDRPGLHGIGCSPGRVTGTARVVEGLDQIGRLQQGDLLVTRFTDTGWTAKFALLNGVVTEYGGMLCHSAIVSREFGIPCVVGVAGAVVAIRDGQRITIDGGAGTVEVES